MVGARALVSRPVRVARRTRQPLCAAFWFAAPLRPAFDTRPVGVGCIERRVPQDASRLLSCLLVSLQAASPVKIKQEWQQTLPIAIYKSV